jgi:hypothetical protein
MKRNYFLRFIVFSVIVLSFFAFLKAVCDDDESTLDLLGQNNYIFSYAALFADDLFNRALYYEHHDNAIVFEPVISYLARQEKSPPV